VIERVVVRRGTYYDSVSLMMLSRDARAIDGVMDATALVATPLNVELLTRNGYELGAEAPGVDDFVLAVRARDEQTIDAVHRLFEAWSSGPGDQTTPAERDPDLNVRSLARRVPDLNLLVVSVAGRYAAYEIAAGLEAGLNVFCFSSGITLAEERALKELAASNDLFLLGPDCGTAILDGVGIGFANAVQPGPVGIVGASGTGIQEVSCLLDAAGIGVSQAIGVGGRDLRPEIGGLMTHRAVDRLVDDPATETIVILSKPVGGEAVASLLAHAGEASKPVVIGIPGGAGDGPTLHGDVHMVSSLEAAASTAAGLHGHVAPAADAAAPPVTSGFVRGLFCGGSLCQEAAAVALPALGQLRSNVPIPGGAMLPSPLRSAGHTFLDLGDEELTDGRLHPMIDPSLRNERALEEGRDPFVGVLLMDVVLGYGAHPDPAETLESVIAQLIDGRAGSLSVVVSVCGTEADPQDLGSQRARLEAAGAVVTRSVAGAARVAVAASGLEDRSAAR
jgi:FdrA protein